MAVRMVMKIPKPEEETKAKSGRQAKRPENPERIYIFLSSWKGNKVNEVARLGDQEAWDTMRRNKACCRLI